MKKIILNIKLQKNDRLLPLHLGTVYYLYSKDGLMTAIVWMDNSIVRMLTSDPYPGTKISTCIRQRKMSKGGLRIHSRPDVIRQYNHSIGGVDKAYDKVYKLNIEILNKKILFQRCGYDYQ